MNLNIRYGQMTMALIAQAAIHNYVNAYQNLTAHGTPTISQKTSSIAWRATFVWHTIPSS